MEKKNLTLIIVSIVFVTLIGTISLFLGVNALENDTTIIEQEKCIELDEIQNEETLDEEEFINNSEEEFEDEFDEENVDYEEEIYEEEDTEYIFYEGIGVLVEDVKTDKEREVIKTAQELYMYGQDAISCGKFDYGKSDGDTFEVKNFEEVNSKFTKDNLVDSLPGGEDFGTFSELMEIKKVKGKYYAGHDCARGSHMGYRGTVLKLISYDETEIKMEATSIYLTEEMDDVTYMETEVDEFIVRKEDNQWKIAKITSFN